MSSHSDSQLDAMLCDVDRSHRRRPAAELGPAARQLAARRRLSRRLVGGSALGVALLLAVWRSTAWVQDDERRSIEPVDQFAQTQGTSSLSPRRRDLEELEAIESLNLQFRQLRRKIAFLDHSVTANEQWRREQRQPLVRRQLASVEQENRAASAWLTLIDPAIAGRLDDRQRGELGELVALYPTTTAANAARAFLAP